MSAFASAISAALRTVAAVAGETIAYHRPDVGSVTLRAVPGTSQANTQDVNDVPVLATSRDWIVQAAALVIGGDVILPQRGDYITQIVAGETLKYEVVFNGDQVYHYCDRARTRIRIHTGENNG